MAASTFTLPENFLSGPAPNPKLRFIDFEKEGIPENEGLYAVVIDGILSPEECEQFTAAVEAHASGKWERALIDVGGGRQAMYEDTRKCGRIIWDSPEVVEKVWARVEPFVPEIRTLKNVPNVVGGGPTKRREIWALTRCNERMRILKYEAGEYFKPHCDGMYETPDEKERSYFTLHLYLNDTDHQPNDEPLEGGATTFWSMNMNDRLDVQPKMGSVLIFQQRFLLHSGDDVERGTKLTMRTAIIYAKVEGEQAP